MNISDKAVEAAANEISKSSGMRFDGFWSRIEDLEPEDREYALAESRAALEAAAPYLMAQAWEEGVEVYPLCYAAVACGACPACMGPDPVNPYRNEAGE